MRAYKEDTPQNTIFNIRQILHRINILPIEHSWCNPKPGLFSTRIENPTINGQFGTNGKGRSQYLALASAYAEFIERIQNGFIVGPNGLTRLLMNKFKEEVGFYFYPDERELAKNDFRNLPENYLADLYGNLDSDEINECINRYFDRLEQNGQKGAISVPFINMSNYNTVYFPYNITFILSGSNGMAAGNTPEEGIFQALCELVERFAARTVYFDQLTPPTVPENYLALFIEEYQIIQAIRNNGYKVLVKDFSCSKLLPAVGVIIIDKTSSKYRLNIGAETSFKLALSRALTEIYQGISNDDFMESFMLPIPTSKQDYFISDSLDCMERREAEMQKFIMNGTGVFPLSLFETNNSYEFSPEAFSPKENYKEEIKQLVKLFGSLGYDIYIRDVSFLGFPSFHVYIPQVSVWGRKSKNGRPTIKSIMRGIEDDKLEDFFFPSQTLLDSPERLKSLLNILAPNRDVLYSKLRLSEMLKLDFRQECSFTHISVNFFITLLCFANKEYRNAMKFLKAFINENDLHDNDYYSSVYSLFSYYDSDKTLDELNRNFSSELLNEFSSIETLFSHIDFPLCPNCEDCPLSVHCLTKENYINALNIAKEMKRNNKQTQRINLQKILG